MSALLFYLHQSQTSIFPGGSSSYWCLAPCADLHCDWMASLSNVNGCQIYFVRMRVFLICGAAESEARKTRRERTQGNDVSDWQDVQ